MTKIEVFKEIEEALTGWKNQKMTINTFLDCMKDSEIESINKLSNFTHIHFCFDFTGKEKHIKNECTARFDNTTGELNNFSIRVL